MNDSIVMLAIFVPLFFMASLFVYNIQNVSSRGYFYGVYVENINLNEKDKKLIDKTYKKKMNITFLILSLILIINIIVFKYNVEIMTMLIMLIYMINSYISLRQSYKEVKLLKNKLLDGSICSKNENIKVLVDTKLLNSKSKIKNKFKILFGICVSLSILSMVYVIINYNNIPDIIPIHWNIQGKADGFTDKSFQSVFYLSFIDLSFVTLLSFLAIESIGARLYIDTHKLKENRNKAVKHLNGVGYGFLFLTIGFQLITTTTSIFVVNEIDMPSFILLLSTLLTIFSTIYLIYHYYKLFSLKARSKDIKSVDSNDEKWLYGIFYYNEEDPSIMVEKRIGLGWTFNLAHKVSKLTTALLIIISIIIPIFSTFI